MLPWVADEAAALRVGVAVASTTTDDRHWCKHVFMPVARTKKTAGLGFARLLIVVVISTAYIYIELASVYMMSIKCILLQ